MKVRLTLCVCVVLLGLLVIAACNPPDAAAVPDTTAVPDAASPPQTAVAIAYEGTAEIEAHYRAPGERRRHRLRLDYMRERDVERLRMTWTKDAQAQPRRETIWLQDQMVIRDSADGATLLSGADAERSRYLVRGIAKALRPESSAQRNYGHPTFGDVLDRVAFGPTQELGAVVAAGDLDIVHHEDDHRWFASLRRVITAQQPIGVIPQPIPAPASATAAPTVTEVAPNVWVAASPATDTVSLVVEFEDFLAVAETSLTVIVGEAMVDQIQARFPDKPIRHVFFSHYHPHYTGGLRAFLAAGATVRAPKQNAGFARDVASRAFTIAPDRWAQRAATASVVAFSGAVVIEDSVNRLEAIDIGSASKHTNEYVLFYLPRSKLLFQGDLGWFAQNQGTIRASSRAGALLKAIDTRKLDVRVLVQGWPIQDPLPIEALRAAVAE